MTPKQAVAKLYKKAKTLDVLQKILDKNGVKTSIPTLSRILAKPTYQPSYQLSVALIDAANKLGDGTLKMPKQ